MSLKPICVKCQRFYRPHKTGRWFAEGMPIRNGAPPGNGAPEQWRPYKVWIGDEWQCQGCGHLIIVGTGHNPVAERYEEQKFNAALEAADYLQVNDC